MKRRRSAAVLVCALAVSAVGGVATAASAAAAPTVTELPVLPGFSSADAADVNDSLVTVGYAVDDRGRKAFRWAADGTPTQLPGLPMEPETYATAVNESGTVVGNSGTFALRWDNGTPSILSRKGVLDTRAEDVNDHGAVAGYQTTYADERQAVKWAADGSAQVLEPYQPSSGNTALAINNSGVVVGHSDLRPVFWEANGKVTALPVPPGTTQGSASGINDRGDIIGTLLVDGGYRAVTWIRDVPGEHNHEKVYRVVLLPLPPNETQSDGVRISDSGAVGVVQDGANPGTHAVKWTPDGQVIVLGDASGRDSSWANGISPNGSVAGNASATDPDKHLPAVAVRWSPS